MTVVPLTLAGSSRRSNVALTTAAVETPVASTAGVRAVIAGGMPPAVVKVQLTADASALPAHVFRPVVSRAV